MSSATPRRDAVMAWLAGDRTAPLVLPPERWCDPEEWSDPEQRIEAVLAMCSSGCRAELPRRAVRINGKLIPPPPTFRHDRRNHAPRPRKVVTP